MALEVTAVMVAVTYLLSLLGITVEKEREELPREKDRFFAIFLVAAPILEAIFLQALPIELVRLAERRYRERIAAPIVAATVLSALYCLDSGIATFLLAGVIGGFYFAFTYARWRTRSWIIAIAVTVALHVLWNLVAFACARASGWFR